MGAFPVLNFPEYCFRLRSGSGGYEVWDALRGIWLVLTPEEWVRQHLIRFLSERMGAVPQYVSQEYPVLLGGMSQRADIVVCALRAAYQRQAAPVFRMGRPGGALRTVG